MNKLDIERVTVNNGGVLFFETTIVSSFINIILNYLKNPNGTQINDNLTYHQLKMGYGLLEFSGISEKDFLEKKEKTLKENDKFQTPRDCGYFNYNGKWYVIIAMDRNGEYSVKTSDKVRFIITP